MLKFVHSVQAKSMQTFDNGNTGLQLNDLDFEDDPSLDVLWYTNDPYPYSKEKLTESGQMTII